VIFGSAEFYAQHGAALSTGVTQDEDDQIEGLVVAVEMSVVRSEAGDTKANVSVQSWGHTLNVSLLHVDDFCSAGWFRKRVV